ncbi:Sds3-like-domain-containing protein [Dimargaris cristalligena]|uniref:Sds3-like-domain-containing protein n=1 Tax=Dimargaris cristalligena TaxID=215637 RepID=A0A4P9ZTA1_9FUNG|nr:Sds3-like-domain-containing protein [Dimargaris cristalligena]|eukprot:RKP35750.1 Sds3-like-domain-containing protein [Dimargaris cristalligena]
MDIDQTEPSTLPSTGTRSEIAKTESLDDAQSEDHGSDAESSRSLVSEQTRQKRKGALEVLGHIEENFARLREKLYEEKISELEDELQLLISEQHPELADTLDRLEEQRRWSQKSAENWRDTRTAHVRNMYNASLQSIGRTYEESKFKLRKTMLHRAERMMRAASDEKRELDRRIFDKYIPPASPGPVSESYSYLKSRIPTDYAINLVMTLNRREADDDLQEMKGRLSTPNSSTERYYPNPANGLPLTLQYDHRRYPPTSDSYYSGPQHHLPPPPLGPVDYSPTTVYARHQPPPTELEALSNVQVDDSRIIYRGSVIQVGDPVFVDNATSGRFTAKLVGVTNQELTLQRTNGSKTKVSLHSIRADTVQLKRKE